MISKSEPIFPEFRVGFVPLRPYVFRCAHNSSLRRTLACVHPGSDAEVLSTVLDSLKITWTLQQIPANQTTTPLSYMRHSLINGMLDVSSVCINRNLKNQQKYHLAPAFYRGGYCVLASAHTTVGSWSSLLEVFSWRTWLFIVLLLVCVRLVVLARHQSKAHRYLKWCTSRAFTHFSFGLLSLFFLNLYQNGLLARLLIREEQYDFWDNLSLAKAVASGQVPLVTYKGSRAPVVGLGKALRKGPTKTLDQFKDVNDLVKYVVDHNGAFLTSQLECDYLASQHCDTRVIILDSYASFTCALAFSPELAPEILTAIDRQMGQLKEVIEGIYARYNNWLSQKRVFCRGRNRVHVLSMWQFLGAFVMLVAGVMGALALLSVEAYLNYNHNDGNQIMSNTDTD